MATLLLALAMGAWLSPGAMGQPLAGPSGGSGPDPVETEEGASDVSRAQLGERRIGGAVALLFGLVLVALFVLIQVRPPKTEDQRRAFGLVLALSASGVAAVIPGFMELDGQLASSLGLRAGGALAVFAVVFLVFVRSRPGDAESAAEPSVGGEEGSKAVPATGAASETATPAEPPLDRTAIPRWIEQILAAEHETEGGFRNFLFDPRAPVQAWSTAQCVVALTQAPEAKRLLPRLERACESMEAARLADGWGYFEGDDVTVTEVACWVTLAHLCLLEKLELWGGAPELADRLESRVARDLEAILGRQHESGGWSPIARTDRRNLRTYTTLMVLWTLAKARECGTLPDPLRYDPPLLRTARWLLNKFDPRLGWVPNPNRSPQREDFLGLTAQVLAVLRYAEGVGREHDILQVLGHDPVHLQAKRWALGHEDFPNRKFARNDNISDADQTLPGTHFRLEGSTFLWCPWSVLCLGLLAADPQLAVDERDKAAQLQGRCLALLSRHRDEVGMAGTYETAETLLCTTAATGGAVPVLGIRTQ